MMVKKLIVVAVIWVLSIAVYAGETEQHQACMQAITKKDKPEDNTPKFQMFNEKMCDCLIAKMNKKDGQDGKQISRSCLFSAFVRVATDDLDENTTESDMMNACQNMLKINKAQAFGNDEKIIADFCPCAQPKLLDLFKKSDSMSEVEYNDSIYSIASTCSANVEIK